MKKLSILSIAALALAGISNIKAYTWQVTNGTTTHKCVTVNASGQRIRQDIEPGETKAFGFGGWKSGLCLTSVAVKEFAEGCPKGLTDIGKATIRSLSGQDLDNLLNAVEQAAVTAATAAISAPGGSAASGAASSATQSAEQAVSSTMQTAMKTASSTATQTATSAMTAQQKSGLIQAGLNAIKASYGLIKNLCSDGKLVMVEDENGKVQVLFAK